MNELKAPMVARILDNLSPEQLRKVYEYAQGTKPFNHGYYWHGPEGELGIRTNDIRFNNFQSCACVLATAFDVESAQTNIAGESDTTWFGAKVNKKLFDAMKFFSEVAGGEVGMNDYITQLSVLDSAELKQMIDERYNAAQSQQG